MKTYVKYGDFDFDSEQGYPVPNFSISVDNTRTSAGSYLSSDMLVTLEGIVYTQKMTTQDWTGTTAAPGTTSILTLFQKASGLKTALLNNNNKSLVIGCGSQVVVSNIGAIKAISFSENENHWAYSINYTVEIGIPLTGSMSPDSNRGYHVSSVQDEYRLEVIEDQTYFYGTQYVPAYRISRTLGATGKSVDSKGALYHAKKWVRDRETTAPLTGIFRYEDFPLYNQSRSVSVSETDGTYTITDSFVSKSGSPWLHMHNTNLSIDSNYIRQIEINGKIQGLQPATGIYAPGSSYSGIGDIKPELTGFPPMTDPASNKYKYQNAVSGYSYITGTFFGTAQAYDKMLRNYSYNWHGNKEFPATFTTPINPIPISVTEGFNPTEGSISYSRTYNSRPLSLIPEALSETINIRESEPVEAISEIFVIGRRLGPVILSTTNALGIGVKTVSYEGVFPRPTGLKGYNFPKTIRDKVNAYISGLMPQSPLTGFIKEDTETLNLTENRLSRTVSWEYTECGTQ